MADINIKWEWLNDNFKRNRKSLEVFCVPILLYNLFGGPLDNISLLGISTNGSGLTRAWLILPVIYLMLIYLSYRYWQSFTIAKKDIKKNALDALFNQYAIEYAKEMFKERMDDNRGSACAVENFSSIQLYTHDNRLIAHHDLTEQEISNINFKIQKDMVTKHEGIGLEIYVPLYLSAATAVSIPINWLISQSWLWV